MANNTAAYVPAIWANETLIWLRKRLVMANLVHRDFEDEVAQRGDTVNTRRPALFTAQNVSGDVTIQDATATNVAVVLDKHKHVAFELSDKEMSLSIKDLVNEFIGPAAYAMAEAVDSDIMALYKDVPYNSGTAGTTPATVAAILDSRKVLEDNKVPGDSRRLVIDPAAENKLLALEVFHAADKMGDAGTAMREASLGRKFGYDTYSTQNIVSHTAGVPGGTPVTNGQILAGVTSVVVASGGNAGTYKKGDIINFAADPKPYVVAADVTLDGSGAGTLTFSPASRVTIPTANAITLKASHTPNLAFHRNAFALVSRPLSAPAADLGVRSSVIQQDGIGIRATVGYNLKGLKHLVVLDLLYGVKTLDIELAARLLG